MANLRGGGGGGGRERDGREEAEVNSFLALLVAVRKGWGKGSTIMSSAQAEDPRSEPSITQGSKGK